MQTTIDGPFGGGAETYESSAAILPSDETIVVMRADDGSLELMAESTTLRLSADDLRLLLFYGSPVEIDLEGGSRAVLTVDPRRYAVILALGRRLFLAPRWVIRAVARGRLPVGYLRAGRSLAGAPLPGSGCASRPADAWS